MLIYPVEGKYSQDQDIDVSVIVPLYKSSLVISEQIARWSQDHDVKTEIVYVDDRCPKGSKTAVMDSWSRRRDRRFFSPKMVLSEKNLGFSGACNLGAYHSLGKHLIFLNADTVVTPNWIRPIVEDLEKPGVGIVGNLQIKDGGQWHGTIDSAGSEWLWDQLNFLHIGRHIWRGELLEKPFLPHEAPDELMAPGEREMVTGCCFGISAKLFRHIGGFDHRYRIGYWEDSEICMTVRELGHRILFQPESVIYHKLHHSNAGQHSAHIRNKIRFARKWIDSGRIDALVHTPRPCPLPKRTNVLVRRQAARGDVLAAAAIAPSIKARHPDAKIYFSTADACESIIEGNPNIAGLARPELNFQEIIDLDLAYERRPDVNIFQAYAEESGYAQEDMALEIAADFSMVPDGDYVVIHAGRTAWAGRNWDSVKFCEIVDQLRARGLNTVAIGHEGDGLSGCSFDLRGKTSIAQLAGVIARSKLFVGIDSMPMHIAQTLRKESVVFFGSIRPETRLVESCMTPVTACGLACLGCHHRQPPPVTSLTICPEGHEKCVTNVSVDDFWRVIEQKLNGVS